MYIKRCDNLDDLVERKIKHDIGELYNYLNSMEDQILGAINSTQLIKHYNLKSTIANRCICPFHSGAKNTTSLVFNDKKHVYNCFGCGESGSYIRFIAQMQNFNINSLNEAKIYAANNFAHLNIGFYSITDFKNQLEILVMERYRNIKSLDLKDYYDISLLGNYVSYKNPVKYTEERTATKNNTINEERKDYKLELFDIDVYLEGFTDNHEDYLYKDAKVNAFQSILIKDMSNAKINDKEKLYNYMLEKYFISKEDCEKYGLVAFASNKRSMLSYPDFYMINDRILFPFTDHDTGIVVGYQARIMGNNRQNSPKYLNITDYGDIKNNCTKQYRGLKKFSVGEFMFNLFILKNRNVKELCITEGAADTIKLASLGYNSISSGQAHLTDHQILLIYRYFGKETKIFLFFDNDDNNVGQHKSILNAYRLFQYGYRNIYIMRTFRELGSDITDVAVKIKDDMALMMLVDIWINEAIKFKPACNDDLDILWRSNIYTESELLTIDPLHIKTIINNFDYIQNHIQLTTLNKDELKHFKKMIYLDKEHIEYLFKKYKDVTVEIINGKNTDVIHENNIVQKNEKQVDIVKGENIGHICNWEPNNMTRGQAYVLRKMFDIDTLITIDEQCSSKQIGSIIGKIKKGIYFDIHDYIK